MKHSKHVRLLLVAALVLLLVVALVACNDGGNKNKDNDPNKNPSVDPGEYPDKTPDDTPDEAQQILELAKADIEAAYNYALALIEENADNPKWNATVAFVYYASNCRVTSMKNKSQVAAVWIDYGTEEEYTQSRAYICLDKESAQAVYDYDLKYISGNDGLLEVYGNKVIYNNSVYQNIQNATRPETITKYTAEQLKFLENRMYKPAQKDDDYHQLTIGCAGGYKYVDYSKYYNQSDCCTDETITIYDNADHFNSASVKNDYDKFQKFKSINYTDDSYFNIDEEACCFSYSLTDKPGWHVDDEYSEPNGKYRARYFYDDPTATAIVPTKIGEYEIEQANIDMAYDTLNEVVIEKPLSSVTLYGSIKNVTIHASDTEFVYIHDDEALEKITFTGTTQQWEKLYENETQGWAHVYDHYDEDKDEDVYIDISFTVECTNGILTYPKTDAERFATLAKLEIEAAYNQFLTMAETYTKGSGCGASINVNYINGNSTMMAGSLTTNSPIVMIDLSYGDENEGDELRTYVCLDSSDNKAVFDFDLICMEGDPWMYEVSGNKVIYNRSLHDDIQNATRPQNITKFSEEQLQFMEDKLYTPLEDGEDYSEIMFDWDSTTDKGNVERQMYPTKGNCYCYEAIKDYESYMRHDADVDKRLSDYFYINYTDDSYIKEDKDAGYVSMRLVDRPGWHMGGNSIGHQDEQTGETIWELEGRWEYYYEELPSALVLPSEVEGHKVDIVEIQLNRQDTLDSLVIENVYEQVWIDGNVKEVTIPDSEEAFVSINDNAALETIHFNGTTDKWNELYGERAQKWTEIYDHTDPQTDQDVNVYITFTVICTNGTLTYTRTNK